MNATTVALHGYMRMPLHSSGLPADKYASYPQRVEKNTEIILSAMHEGIELFGEIDFYDAKQKVIHETKRTDKVEKAHEWPVRFICGCYFKWCKSKIV